MVQIGWWYNMVDVIIKDVPVGAENLVKESALVSIERFIRNRDVKVTEEVTDKFKSDVDKIRAKNNLIKKYEVVEKIVELNK
jgi:hypothetical protein